MHIYISFVMLATLYCTALNAAADGKPTPATQELFALYDPSCSSCCKSTISMRGGIDEKCKKLTLTVTKDDQPISDTVKLWGNELYIERQTGPLPQRFQWKGEYLKLSLAARVQYERVYKRPTNSKDIYPAVEDSRFRSVYFCGKFLILNTKQEVQPLVPPSHESIVTIIQTLKPMHTSNPSKFPHPLIIVNIDQWLVNCFGSDWEQKLPIYRHPITNETMTQAEYNAKYPKNGGDTGTC